MLITEDGYRYLTGDPSMRKDLELMLCSNEEGVSNLNPLDENIVNAQGGSWIRFDIPSMNRTESNNTHGNIISISPDISGVETVNGFCEVAVGTKSPSKILFYDVITNSDGTQVVLSSDRNDMSPKINIFYDNEIKSYNTSLDSEEYSLIITYLDKDNYEYISGEISAKLYNESGFILDLGLEFSKWDHELTEVTYNITYDQTPLDQSYTVLKTPCGRFKIEFQDGPNVDPISKLPISSQGPVTIPIKLSFN